MAHQALSAVLDYLRKVSATTEMQDLADAALLERFVANREESAFAILVHRHGPMVLGVCRRVLGDAHNAEDAFQATFLVLVRKAASLRKRELLSNWLYGVAQRIALKARAKAAVRQSRQRELTDMSQNHGHLRVGESIDELTWQELRPVLDEEIGRLPQKYRAPLVLCYLQGKSHEVAARELGCPRRSLSSRLTRARELLRRKLIRRGIALSAAALLTTLTEKTVGAAVAAAFTINTTKAVVSLAAGKIVAADVLSTQAMALAEEAIMGMVWNKVKLVLMIAFMSLAVGGVALAGYRGLSRGEEVAETTKTAGNLPPRADVIEPKKNDAAPAVEINGDPLPVGAVARLGGTRPLLSLQFTSDGKYILDANWRSLRRWDAATGKEIGWFSLPDDFPKLLAKAPGSVSPDGSMLSFGERKFKKGVKYTLVDAATGKAISQFTVDEAIESTHARFSPDAKTFAVFQAGDGSVALYDVATGKLLRTLDPVAGLEGKGGRIIVFSADGKLLACYGIQGPVGVKLWDTSTGKQAGSLPLPFGPRDVSDEKVVFSPDGRCMAVDADNGKIALYELVTCQVRSSFGMQIPESDIPKIGSPKRSPSLFAFSPDGHLIAVAGPDNNVRLLDVATGKELAFFKGHTDLMHGIAYAPDGKTIASASFDKTGFVWDVSRNKRPAPPGKTLTPADLDMCWQTLIEPDAAKAWTRMIDLVAAPKDAVPWIKERVKPATSADVKQEHQEKPISMILQGERLRAYRAIEVLELMAAPEARQVLQALAEGTPGALVTMSAQAALKR